MVEIYLVFILVCGYDGECGLFKDKGYAYTLQECHRKIDHMWIRIRAKPKGVERTKVGKFSFVVEPRGFCIHRDYEESPYTLMRKRYKL